MKKTKRIIAAMLACVLAAGCVAGCSKNEQKSSADLSFGDTYPLKTDATLTYWVYAGFNATEDWKTYADIPFHTAMREATGVNVEFIHPSKTSASEQFNIMVASGEYPDILQFDSFYYPGGATQAIEDGVIVDLTDKMEKYAPNLMAYLKEHPEIDKQVKTDDGRYYSFPMISEDPYLLTYTGLMLRQDWLDELGLEVPTTIDEWENVLTAFKEKKGLKSAITWELSKLRDSNAFLGAYGVGNDLYIDNKGKVQYGYAQEGYKKFLAKMNDWYKKGLIDPNLASMKTKSVDQAMINDEVGATISNTLSGIGAYTIARSGDGTAFKLVAAPNPTLKKGEKPEFGHMSQQFTGAGECAISTQCENVELAMKWLDYGFTEEGHDLCAFGVEGLSYTVDENGVINYTDLMLNNPDKKGFMELIQYYTGPWFPHVKDRRYMEAGAPLPEQKESIDIWMDTNQSKHILPKLRFTQEDSSRASALKAEIDTYVQEMFYKFIMGAEPIEKFDTEYIETLKEIGLDEYLELNREAYDKYKKK